MSQLRRGRLYGGDDFFFGGFRGCALAGGGLAIHILAHKIGNFVEALFLSAPSASFAVKFFAIDPRSSAVKLLLFQITAIPAMTCDHGDHFSQTPFLFRQSRPLP